MNSSTNYSTETVCAKCWLVDFIDQPFLEQISLSDHYRILVELHSPTEVGSKQETTKISVTVFFGAQENAECSIANRYVLFSNYIAQQNFNSFLFKFENSENGTPVKTLSDLIDSTITYCIESGLLFEKYRYCGRYFLAFSRSMVYCRRLMKGSKNTCNHGGSFRLYKLKSKEIPAMNVFYKKYRQMENLTEKGKMTREEFTLLSNKIREQRDLCLNGKLSQEDFKKWIKTAN